MGRRNHLGCENPFTEQNAGVTTSLKMMLGALGCQKIRLEQGFVSRVNLIIRLPDNCGYIGGEDGE
jgi:hypothetical protein